MVRRKVQRVSNGTFTVSLPKEWTQAVDIDAGTEVSIQTHRDDVLVVEPNAPGSEQRPVTVAIDDLPGAGLEAVVRATYAAGVDRARFTTADGVDDATTATIRRTARNLNGVTIDRDAPGEVVLDTLLDPQEVSITQSVRQLLHVAVDAHREAVTAAVDPEAPSATTVQDDHADRMFALVDRHLQRALRSLDEVDSLGLTRPELFARWRTARALERVADHAEQIAALGDDVDADPETADRVTGVAARTRRLLETSVDTVLDATDPVAAQAALRERDAIHRKVHSVREPRIEARDVQVVRILDRLERTATLAGNVAEVGLRTAVHPPPSDP